MFKKSLVCQIKLKHLIYLIHTFSSVSSGELSKTRAWVVDGTGIAVVDDPFPPKFNLNPGLNGLILGLILFLQ